MKPGRGKETGVFYVNNIGGESAVYTCKMAAQGLCNCNHVVCGGCYENIRSTWSVQNKKANGRRLRGSLADVAKRLKLD